VIRTRIITGVIPAGELNTVGELARELGVSATPIREALMDLANEGIVEVMRNRGFRVPVLSEHDLDELFELRLLLEVPALSRLAGGLDDAALERYRQVAERIAAHARAGDLISFLDEDRDFHLRLIGELGNRRLVETVRRLREQTRMVGLPDLAEQRSLRSSADEHVEIVRALAAGDGERAATIMHRHLEHTRGIWAGHDEVEAQPDGDGEAHTGASRGGLATEQ